MEDRQLEDLARNLGRDAKARIDAEQVAQAVLRRLRVEPAAPPWYRRIRVQVAAAAAVLVLATTLTLWPPSVDPPAPMAGPEPFALTLEELSEAELTTVLDSLELEAPLVEVMQVGFYDLDEEQLENLLESLED